MKISCIRSLIGVVSIACLGYVAGTALLSFGVGMAVGAALWVGILVTGGYYLGQSFPGIINYVQYIILFFLAITTFTVIKGYLKLRQ